MTKLFALVLVVVLLVAAIPVGASPTVQRSGGGYPKAGWFYCSAAYISLAVSVWNGDVWGEGVSMAILSYQC